MATSKLFQPEKVFKSTISFRDAVGSPDATAGAEAFADYFDDHFDSNKFGTLANVGLYYGDGSTSSGGKGTVMYGGFSSDYYELTISSYNIFYDHIKCVKRSGKYCVIRSTPLNF